MGTPEFAVPSLRQLTQAGLAPVAVYTQPPRRQGRGLHVVHPPVALCAEELGLPVRQPDLLQCRTEMGFLREVAPDVIVTAAYGRIFRRRLLELPRLGCINLHPSLLPRFRGLSPIPWAILRGSDQTGVTIYRMDERVDAGSILLQKSTPIEPGETGGVLAARLARLGAEALVETLCAMDHGDLPATPQDEALASYAPRLMREDGRIDWRLPAVQIERLVRALAPWPGTFTFCRRARVKLLAVEVADQMPRDVPPGTILKAGGSARPTIAAQPGAVLLHRVQPENCRPQDGVAFCCGQRIQPGQRLTGQPVECPPEARHA